MQQSIVSTTISIATSPGGGSSGTLVEKVERAQLSRAEQDRLDGVKARFLELYRGEDVGLAIADGSDGALAVTAAGIEFVHFVVCRDDQDDEDDEIFWFSRDWTRRLSLPLSRVSTLLEQLGVVVWATELEDIASAPLMTRLSVLGATWTVHSLFHIKQAQ